MIDRRVNDSSVRRILDDFHDPPVCGKSALFGQSILREIAVNLSEKRKREAGVENNRFAEDLECGKGGESTVTGVIDTYAFVDFNAYSSSERMPQLCHACLGNNTDVCTAGKNIDPRSSIREQIRERIKRGCRLICGGAKREVAGRDREREGERDETRQTPDTRLELVRTAARTGFRIGGKKLFDLGIEEFKKTSKGLHESNSAWERTRATGVERPLLSRSPSVKAMIVSSCYTRRNGVIRSEKKEREV
ncbi:hypothetical protein ALC53_06289 [Atta colombica]|uniref:Uncharacterized protein n=1 Tax=Atta colombica TaxID=520822 RepID=A0A195BFN9_9HYME|nr:hypothetical protein ALC53_06289 [Atta colombica]